MRPAKDKGSEQKNPRKSKSALEDPSDSATLENATRVTVTKQLEEQGVDLVILTEAAIDGVWQQCTAENIEKLEQMAENADKALKEAGIDVQ